MGFETFHHWMWISTFKRAIFLGNACKNLFWKFTIFVFKGITDNESCYKKRRRRRRREEMFCWIFVVASEHSKVIVIMCFLIRRELTKKCLVSFLLHARHIKMQLWAPSLPPPTTPSLEFQEQRVQKSWWAMNASPFLN